MIDIIDDSMERRLEKREKALKWFIGVLISFLTIHVAVFFLNMKTDIVWLDSFSAILNISLNIGSIAFVLYNWIGYCKYSREREQETKEYKERILAFDANADIDLWFDHKKSRIQISVLNAFVILINIGILVWHLIVLFK